MTVLFFAVVVGYPRLMEFVEPSRFHHLRPSVIPAHGDFSIQQVGVLATVGDHLHVGPLPEQPSDSTEGSGAEEGV